MKKFLSLLIVVTIVLSSVAVFATETVTTTTPEISFSDVNAETDTGKAIYKLVDAGILNGYLDGTFKPGNTLTRAELCKIINLVFGYTEADTENFKDVKKEDWFYDYVAVAKKAGYINGFEDGTFRGNEKLTREQSCAIIARVGELFDLPMTETITDKVSDWAVPYVNKVVANKLMSLEEGGKFRATENITRGELTLVASNFVVEETVPENANEITVTVKIEGDGKATGAGKYEKGKDVTLKAVAEFGSTFSGWFVNNKNVSKSLTYTFKAEKDITVTAKFAKESSGGGGGGGGGGSSDSSPVTYSVKFKTGVEDITVDSQTVEKGETATRPEDPERQGYEFVDWYEDALCTKVFDFSTPIKKNYTLVAKWEAVLDEELQETALESMRAVLALLNGNRFSAVQSGVINPVKTALSGVIADGTTPGADGKVAIIYDSNYLYENYGDLISEAKAAYYGDEEDGIVGMTESEQASFQSKLITIAEESQDNKAAINTLLKLLFNTTYDELKARETAN